MRIFVLSIVDLRVPDAQRVHLLEKWSRIAAHGNDVQLWVYGHDQSMASMGGPNMTIRCVPHLRIKYVMDLTYQLFLLASVIRCALSQLPAAIYVRNSALDFASLGASLLFNLPLIVELPGPILEEGARYGFSPLKYRLAAWLMERKMRQAAQVITVTEPIKQGLVQSYGLDPARISVIQNAANTELFIPVAREAALGELGLDSARTYVGFVGNLSPWHGVEVLVEAGIEVIKNDCSITFLIVGDGVTRDRLEARVRELGLSGNFLFTGAVPYCKVPLYVASCHLMTLPLINKAENDSGYSPLKLYEYMACARPVLASRLSGLEVIEEEATGRLVASNDPVALAGAITSMLADRTLLEKMGLNGRRVAVERFDWKIVARHAEKVIVGVIG